MHFQILDMTSFEGNIKQRNDNAIILVILCDAATVFIIITSLPAIIIEILFTLIFIKVRVNKLIFSISGLGLGVLLNIKVKFSENYLLSVINFIKKYLQMVII
jgi:hypothetical protein